jgi:hypothetical protein
VRCACGKPIAEERVEETVAMTDLGRNLLDGNRWLTLLLLEELQKVGIPLDQTLIEQQVGGDEIDCLAVISGDLVFFELKDKDFNLGNTYSFGAKMGIIRPKRAVIFSTQNIGGDAREHFERLRPRTRTGDLAREQAEIYYIEGLANLAVELQKIAGIIYTNDAVRILRRVLPLASVKSLIRYLNRIISP